MPVRRRVQGGAWRLALGLCLLGIAPWLVAQSGAAPQGQADPKKQTEPAKPSGDNDNPFPGESSDAPILPVNPPAGASGQPEDRPARNADATDGGKAAADPDGDPVRSPDGAGAPADDGFSSSRSGLKQMPAEDDSVDAPGNSGKNKTVKKKTREQVVKEDVDIGSFYLDRKNWRAAQGRFQDAFALNPEDPEAVFGLAEAERHLNLNAKAREHYELFLTYDPEGPHGRAARKGLEQVESAEPAGSGSNTAGASNVPPK